MINSKRRWIPLPAQPQTISAQSAAHKIARALEADESAIKIIEGFHGYCYVAVTSRGEEIIHDMIAKLLLEGKGAA